MATWEDVFLENFFFEKFPFVNMHVSGLNLIYFTVHCECNFAKKLSINSLDTNKIKILL